MKFTAIFILLLLLHFPLLLPARPQLLDGFESPAGWTTIASDAVTIDTSLAPGHSGKALRIDFDFEAGSGYCGIEKAFPRELPQNFQFSFYLKGEAPVNNLEFKIVDASGDNVWWEIRRNYEFPQNWTRIRVKRRHISFAWGPAQDRTLRRVDKIQFIISSATGGAGTIYLDDFTFEKREVPAANPPPPAVSATSPQNIIFVLDSSRQTVWRSARQPVRQQIVLDLRKYREFGGLVIDWDQLDYALQYDVLVSSDGREWEPAYLVTRGSGGRSYINLRDMEGRFIKLDLKKSSRGAGYAVQDLYVKNFDFSDDPNAFFAHIAAEQPRGRFPKYLYHQQSYWTVVGANTDRKEALINEQGTVEVDKKQFSIEPFLFVDGRFFTWNDAELRQSLAGDYLPVPSVHWNTGSLALTVQAFAEGPPDSSQLYLMYTVANADSARPGARLYLAIRPFQVNPPWQFLNIRGGVAEIDSISFLRGTVQVNREKRVVPLTTPDGFGAAEFDEGDITGFISADSLPPRQQITDHTGYGSAALRFAFDLFPGEKDTVCLGIPFHAASPNPRELLDGQPAPAFVNKRLQRILDFWTAKLNVVEFRLPASGDKLVNSIRSNLAYILINRDGPGIQPGSRSYERSWIRDGSMTSSALLKMGIQPEVKEFLDWYSRYQYPNGKVPCVVDRRGPDPVPENDSHGELIFGLMQYYLFTGDTAFLGDKFRHISGSVDYMNSLISRRLTAKYKNGGDSLRAFYGLLPESISHEGYSAKPMHSYWDDFWGLKGFKDAAQAANLLGRRPDFQKFAAARDSFHTHLYQSVQLAVQNHGIDYIPGSVELGDFDATSTAIAVYPCNELHHLPQPYARNTFDRYYDFFQKRRAGAIDWENYTPYEVRLAGTFNYLNQPERAHALLDFFFADQRPAAWNQWAEVVWRDRNAPKFIGDMPHTWVGSDFISAARSMFVYEDELRRQLVLGAGLYREWTDAPQGMAVNSLPTYYGILNFAVQITASGYRVEVDGDLRLPDNGLRIKNWRGVPPAAVSVNGRPAAKYDKSWIYLSGFPARVEIKYPE